MVAGGHRIIAKDALKLVESLSHTTPTHGQTEALSQKLLFPSGSTTSVIGSLFDGQGLVRKKWCCASGLLGWWPVVTGLLQKMH